MFLNAACVLTLFDIGAPMNEKLEANFNEEHLLRYFIIPLSFLRCIVSSVFVTDVYLKETGPIQVHDKTSL